MRRNVIYFILGLLLVGGIVGFTRGKEPTQAEGREEFVQGEILVKFKKEASAEQVGKLHQQLRGKVKKTIPGIDVQVVKVDQSVGQAVSAYARQGLVEYAEPNFIAQALTTDTYFPDQWGLDNQGQKCCNTEEECITEGTVDADIDVPEAWDITFGNSEVKIAILDSGIDDSHTDLDDKIVLQQDFTDSTSGYKDIYGHGTHVAGIAAAETNNEQGVAGVGYNSSLINGKVLNDEGSGAYSWVANGITWAANNGAQVINMSLGGSQKSATLEDAVNYAWNNGVVIVAAAGNSGNPSPTYPAKYDNVIAVAATNNNDQIANFSSYSSKWVQVAAPGVDILSTFPTYKYVIGKNYNYDFGSGTSMSTPHVVGLAALVWATEIGTSNSAVREQIQDTADPIPGTGQYWIYGRVNACNAVGGSCSYQGTEPTPTPTESEEEPTPTPTESEQDCSSCFKGVCDGRCHPAKEDDTCPDCF